MRLYNKNGIIYSDETKTINGIVKRIRKSLKIPYSKANLKKLKNAFLKEQQKDLITKDLRTFENVFSEYILSKEVDGKIRKNTIKRYKNDIEMHALPVFHKKYIHEIDVQNIEHLMNNLLIGLNSKRVKNIFIPIRGAFALALRYKYIKENPFTIVKNIETKIGEERKLNPFSLMEIKLLIKKADNKNLKNFIALSWYLGTRPSELIALKWKDINLTKQYVEINGAITGRETLEERNLTKSKSSRRRIYFSKKALDYFKKNDEEYVFITEYKKAYHSAKTLRERFVKLLKEERLDNHSLNDIRHSYASIHLSNNTLPLVLISKQMGHKDPSITLQKYSSYIKSKEDETIKLMDNAFKN